ncbi:hypothetical protein AAC691_06420 [Nguyenibacter vanlangensis]|uniref:Type II secretion system protein GspC N-terminal domain-containing protein n=1 Tax=Nguyenibacter vanlangensis TaxID=1216886 RepID=A0ABZ3D8E3_9PROT
MTRTGYPSARRAPWRTGAFRLAAMMLCAASAPARAQSPPAPGGQGLPDAARIDAWRQTVLARPLFSPSRRPATAQGAAAGTPRLAGIVVSGGRRHAIFMIPGQDRGQVADIGATVGPWRVVAIEGGAVRVRGAGGEQSLRPDRDRGADLRPAGPSSGASPASQPDNQTDDQLPGHMQ